MELEFDTHEEAFEWYNKYAKCVSFGVRKDDYRGIVRVRYCGGNLCVAEKD